MGTVNGDLSQEMNTDTDESILIKRIKSGDEIAFKVVYDRYQRRLRHYAFKITKSRFMADELLQEAFLRIWLDRKKLKPELSFDHYLFKVAKNLALKHFRKVALDERLKKQQLNNIEKVSNATQNIITFKEYQHLVQEVIQNLPPRNRSIYLMSRQEGKSNQAIATALNISEKTVRNNLVLALKAIKEKLLHTTEITLTLLLVVLS
ncbi:MAG: RNA polymerase sigma-70 factor [Cytophagales bacterium]|nr:RNA polymerase sigma-70 factor [Cytophagales bacterium]